MYHILFLQFKIKFKYIHSLTFVIYQMLKVSLIFIQKSKDNTCKLKVHLNVNSHTFILLLKDKLLEQTVHEFDNFLDLHGLLNLV